MFRLGPILYLRGASQTSWQLDLHVVVDTRDDVGPPQLVLNGAVQAPQLVHEDTVVLQRRVYRWALALPRGSATSYELRYGGRSSQHGPIFAPAADELPQIAFFSCNGFSSAKYANRVGDPQALFKQIRARGAEDPVHLLLGGGDQIYADELWYKIDLLERYRELPVARAKRLNVSSRSRTALRRGYRDLYEKRWRGAFAELLERVPIVATWDDHDIFDGWGSYDDGEQEDNNVFSAVFEAAAETFDLFQCGLAPRPTDQHRLQAVRVDSTHAVLDLLLLDIRTHRTPRQVLAPAQWDAVKAQLNTWSGEKSRPRHLAVVSSIPVIYIRFSAAVEAGSAWVPGGLADDLRDQWESEVHRGERAKLLMNLLRHQSRCGQTRVTLLSGDVHVASRGRVESALREHQVAGNPGTIEQITASAILHAPPTWLEWQAIRALGDESPASVAPGVSTRLLKVGGRYAYRGRNFLDLRFETEAGHAELWARWVTEGARLDEAVVVHTPKPANMGGTG